MSEVRIELRLTKTVMRQSQDETWSYETRDKTRHECVQTKPRQRRVNMCLKMTLSRDSITGNTLLPHFCFTTKFGRSRSNGIWVQKWGPKFWVCWGPAPLGCGDWLIYGTRNTLLHRVLALHFLWV